MWLLLWLWSIAIELELEAVHDGELEVVHGSLGGGGGADGGGVVAYRGPGAFANPTPSVVITILSGVDRVRERTDASNG